MTDNGGPPGQRPTETGGDAVASAGRIGPYRLLQKLGEGGMGEVWEAEQEEPVRRRVALKLIKAGMDTKQVVARFESERQALALMSHPSIAKVFDAGAAEQGRPYFAMEYVRGEPITGYCDKHRLSTAERLALFVQVCDGVQHAHQKGIIHRDLKPSNVLVELSDGKPVPKIIDFGVAKATQQRLTEKTMFTQLGVLVGTPAYVSPEQAEMTGLDVDTRTDVYSLGVMLYELLVGALPFDPKELKAAGYDEIRRKIREEEPSRPSARITTPGEESTEAAKRRKVDLPTLKRELRGDLDWITMKALAKDRTRRYGSPNELAADIGRHLRHEPVEAGPPSAAYRMGKFVRRHRVGVAAGAIVLLALIAGLAGATYGLVRATRAEAQALEEAATAEQVSDFLVGLFEVSDPSQARGNEITAREILDQGAERISRELKDQPLVRARLLHTMGRVYLSLWLHDRARPLLDQALKIRRDELGNADPAVADSLMQLGELLDETGDHQTARARVEEALAIREAAYGPDDPRVAECLANLAKALLMLQDAERVPALLERMLDIVERTLGPDDTGEKSTLAWLPSYDIVGLPKARELLERELKIREAALGPGHPTVAESMYALGRHHVMADDFVGGLPLLERAMVLAEESYGPDHPETVEMMFGVAHALMRAGNGEAAQPLAERCLSVAQDIYGAGSRWTGQALFLVGILKLQAGDRPRAHALLERSVEIIEKTSGHPLMLAATLHDFGGLLAQRGDVERARRLLERSVAITEQYLGRDHFETGLFVGTLGSILVEAGALDEARPHLERCVEIGLASPETADPWLAQALMHLTHVHAAAGDYEAGRRLFERAVATLQRRPDPPGMGLSFALWGLGRMHLLAGEREKGRALFERSLSIFEEVFGEDDPSAPYNRACFHALMGERDEAIRFLKRALELGYADSKVATDPDLEPLHGDPEFEAVVAEARRRDEVGESQ